MLANGATTLWERWEMLNGYGMNLHNHPMMGSLSAWFYKYLAGINTDPREVVHLEKTVDLPAEAFRVSVFLQDGDGQNRGFLGNVF